MRCFLLLAMIGLLYGCDINIAKQPTTLTCRSNIDCLNEQICSSGACKDSSQRSLAPPQDARPSPPPPTDAGSPPTRRTPPQGTACRNWSPSHTVDAHKGDVRSLAFNQDSILASGGGSTPSGGDSSNNPRRILLWNFGTGKRIAEMKGSGGSIHQLAFAPSGKVLISASGDTYLRAWDTEKADLLKRFGNHDGEVVSIAFSPDRKQLASGGYKGDEKIHLWSWPELKKTQTLKDPWPGYVLALAYSNDGASLFSGGYYVQSWTPTKSNNGQYVFKGQTPIWGLAPHPIDQNTLAYGLADGKLVVANVKDNNKKEIPKAHGDRVHQIRYSPSGNMLFTSGGDGNVVLWDPAKGYQKVKTIPNPGIRITSLAIHPKGTAMAFGGSDGKIRIWKCR